MVYSFMNSTAQAIIPTHYIRRSFQPGKKIILMSIILSVLLFMSQIFSSFHKRKPVKLSLHAIYKSSDHLSEDLEFPSCHKSYLDSKRPSPKPQDTCHHIVPSKDICTVIHELFHSISPKSCTYQQKVNICQVEDGEIVCIVPEGCAMIYIGVFNHKSADTVWEEVQVDSLEKKIKAITRDRHFKGYIFIKCSSNGLFRNESLYDVEKHSTYDVELNDDSDEGSSEYLSDTQLFLYPRVYAPIPPNKNKAKSPYPNINMVMIDSLSRDHLFRSLPQTINFLKDLKDGSTHAVIDFSFFQSLKLRTYENLQALFSGYVDIFTKPFGTYSTPFYPLPIDVLFKKYKRRGYQTLWLEDLCWEWEWGLVKDLKVLNKSLSSTKLWENFRKGLEMAKIDAIDVTLSSCEILRANKLNDPFHGAPAVCYNGKYQHEYLLEYLQLYQEREQRSNQNPFFSFTSLDVSHEETGVRVQSLDPSLRKYLEGVQNFQNTITIIFSDHGNGYGTYMERSSDAYIEGFSPFLIFLIPDQISKIIGDSKMKRMEENSQHLVSLIDVHETLLTFIGESNAQRDADFISKYVISGGLLGNISSKRTCDDLPLIMPNLCICRDFDFSVKVNDLHYAYAEFSLGVINNMVLRERVKIGNNGFGKCQLLRVNSVISVKERRKSGDLTQFKLHVKATGVLTSVEELFFFVVEVGLGNPSIRLINFERNSPYAKYKSCKDQNVDPRMCFCEKMIKKTKIDFWQFILPDFFSLSRNGLNDKRLLARKQIQAFFDNPSPHSSSQVDRSYPEKNSCLFIVRHKYENSFNIFGINVCSIVHKVTLEIKNKNMFLTDDFISSHILYPLDVRHLIGGTQANLKLSWVLDYIVFIDQSF